MSPPPRHANLAVVRGEVIAAAVIDGAKAAAPTLPRIIHGACDLLQLR